MRKFIFCFLLISFIFLINNKAFSQDASGVFLKGFVKTSKGESIPTEVIIGDGSKALNTDNDGFYRLTEFDFYNNGEVSFLLKQNNKYLHNLFRANIGPGYYTTCDITIDDYYAIIKITETVKNNSIEEPFLILDAIPKTLPNTCIGVKLEIRGIQNQFQKTTFVSTSPSNKVFLFLPPGTYEIQPTSRPDIKSFIVEILPNSGTTCKFYLGKLLGFGLKDY